MDRINTRRNKVKTTNTAYKEEVWDQYAQAFLSVMPSIMLDLNKEVANLSTGNVCDFGCGAAKIAPFVLGRDDVISYTGVDYSLNMVKLARWHLAQFPSKPSKVIHGKIEALNTSGHEGETASKAISEVDKTHYDFGLSINSYYTWDNPEKVLQSIFNTLAADARFVLVTPNRTLDIVKLLAEVKTEQVANPYFNSFMEQNMAIAGNEKALFIEMDALISQVQSVGFKVIEATQRLYHNGLNFLYLSK
jgi:SAM-dependent methyltransferase